MKENLEVMVVPQERVQQRSLEEVEDVPQSPDETVELAKLVSHERGQQWSAERVEDVLQTPEKWRSTGDGKPRPAFAACSGAALRGSCIS